MLHSHALVMKILVKKNIDTGSLLEQIIQKSQAQVYLRLHRVCARVILQIPGISCEPYQLLEFWWVMKEASHKSESKCGILWSEEGWRNHKSFSFFPMSVESSLVYHGSWIITRWCQIFELWCILSHFIQVHLSLLAPTDSSAFSLEYRSRSHA